MESPTPEVIQKILSDEARVSVRVGDGRLLADPGASEAPASDEDWRIAAAKRAKEAEVRQAEAKTNRVYLAKGPIVGAVLLANLITAAIVAAVYALLTAH